MSNIDLSAHYWNILCFDPFNRIRQAGHSDQALTMSVCGQAKRTREHSSDYAIAHFGIFPSLQVRIYHFQQGRIGLPIQAVFVENLGHVGLFLDIRAAVKYNIP
ncbi:hypothetical protein D3C76_1316350 [compost metagenome]